MTENDLLTEFFFGGGEEYSELQFIAFANEILDTRDGDEEDTRKVAQSMIRAALHVCLERDPLRYYDFLARIVLKSTLDEMDRAEKWAMRIVEEKGL